ncbi:MAG: DUF2188 domain-containing protein [Verrucomicrobia bacterium]|nr:DUF2188 domain-containing protein [Verrucomicrobiota bacterium]
MSATSVFFVKPAGGGWRLSTEPDRPPFASFLTLKQALAAARQQGETGSHIEIVILDRTGRWVTKYSYSKAVEEKEAREAAVAG